MSFREIYEQENYENTLSYIVEQIEERYDTYLSEDEVALVYETLAAYNDIAMLTEGNIVKAVSKNLANFGSSGLAAARQATPQAGGGLWNTVKNWFTGGPEISASAFRNAYKTGTAEAALGANKKYNTLSKKYNALNDEANKLWDASEIALRKNKKSKAEIKKLKEEFFDKYGNGELKKLRGEYEGASTGILKNNASQLDNMADDAYQQYLKGRQQTLLTRGGATVGAGALGTYLAV